MIAKRREDSGMHGNQGGKKKERKKKEEIKQRGKLGRYRKQLGERVCEEGGVSGGAL